MTPALPRSPLICLADTVIDDLILGHLDESAVLEVERHLDGCADCSDLVMTLAGGSPFLPSAGERIGRHEVVRIIGSGAMGVVVLAHDPELDRAVALKLLRRGALAASDERLIQEAQAMAKLAHPNVATVFEVGRSGADVYLSMEYIEGETLGQWLDGKARSEAEILQVFVQAGQGLAAAHQACIVHRDFKPANVMVGAEGRVRVTDFGLSASSDQESAAYRLVGTPAYMAPEQLAGEEITAASDQFAFGVCLFEALTGQPPFSGLTLEERSQSILEGPDLSALASRPQPLRQVLRRALAQAPSERFASMLDLVAELQAAARQDHLVPKPASRRWLAVPAGAMAVAAAVLVWPAAPEARRETAECVAPTQRIEALWNAEKQQRIDNSFRASDPEHAATALRAATPLLQAYSTELREAAANLCGDANPNEGQPQTRIDSACLHRRLSAFETLTTKLAHADQRSVLAASLLSAELLAVSDCQGAASPRLSPRPSDAATEASLIALELEVDALLATRATPAAADMTLSKELIARASALGYAPLQAEAHIVAARLARKLGDLEAAREHADQAQALAEAAGADGIAARAWLEVIAAAGEGGRLTAALEHCQRAEAAILRLGNPPRLAAALALLRGLALTGLEQHEAALAELQRAAQLYQALAGKGLEQGRVLTALGDLARRTDQLDKSLDYHQKALVADAELLGPGHPALARHHHNIAGVLKRKSQPAEAIASYGRALELQRLLGDQHPAVGLTENSLGLVLIEAGNPALAEEHLLRAKANLDLAKHPDRALPRLNLARIFAERGKHEDASAEIDAALIVLRANLGEDHVKVGQALLARSNSLAAMARHEASLRDLREAARIAALGDDLAKKQLQDSIDAARSASAPGAPAAPSAAAAMKPPPATSASSKATAGPPPSTGGAYGPATSWDRN